MSVREAGLCSIGIFDALLIRKHVIAMIAKSCSQTPLRLLPEGVEKLAGGEARLCRARTTGSRERCIRTQVSMPEACESRAQTARGRWAAERFSHTSGMPPGTGMFSWHGPVVPAAPLRGFASPPANLSAPCREPKICPSMQSLYFDTQLDRRRAEILENFTNYHERA